METTCHSREPLGLSKTANWAPGHIFVFKRLGWHVLPQRGGLHPVLGDTSAAAGGGAPLCFSYMIPSLPLHIIYLDFGLCFLET